MIAFCSAWSVRWQLSRPSTIRIRHPTSSQCGSPEGLPLYPVVRMRLSRTITAPTASRGHVERVATSWAMRMKYSSQEGRAFFRASWEFEVSTAGFSKGSIESISGVAEARDDERAVVQFRVDGGGVEGHVGMLAGNPFDAWHGGDRVEASDPGRPLFLELVYGGREAPSSRQHWVEDEDQVLVEVAREVDVVLDRLGRLLVALETHKADRRCRQEGERPVEHAEAGAQDGDEADGTGDLLDLRLGQGRADLDLAGRQISCGLGDHDEGEFLHGLPEVRGRGPLVAEDRELVATQGAVYQVEVLHVGPGLTHTAGRLP